MLKYHIVPDAPLRASDLVDGMEVPTNDGSEVLTVSVDGDGVTVNGFGASSARITEADIGAGDAVIHVVDAVLLPFDPADALAPPEEPPEEPPPEEAAPPPGEAPAPAADSVAALALGEPSLSTLVDAIVAADLQGLVADPALVATVLAPTNGAFADLLDALGLGALGELPADTLREVLAYHIVPGVALTSAGLSDGFMLPTLSPADMATPTEDRRLEVAVVDGGLAGEDKLRLVGAGSSAEVVAADLAAGESVVHVIDAVLLPFEVGGAEPAPEPEAEGPFIVGLGEECNPTVSPAFATICDDGLTCEVPAGSGLGASGVCVEVGGGEPAPEPEAECPSIAEVASSVPDLSILVDAVVAAGLVDALSNGEDVLTVFAPTNDAFVALLGALGLESLEDVPIDALTTVLLYHVVPGVAAYSTDLTDGQVITTLEGSDLTVDLALDISTGSVGVEILGVGSDATVIIADVPACNSVVHVIDAVLLPFELPGGDEPVEEDDDDDARLPGGPPASGPGGRFCLPRKAPCAFNFQCCSGRCRGPSLIFPFYRKCTLF